MSEENSTPVRRTARQKKPSLKAMESLYISKLKNSGFVASVSSSDEYYSSDECAELSPEKPKLLHENDEICGEEIFTFKKRNQRASMALKAAEVQKTPHTVRTKMKNKLKAVFEDSGSEFEAPSGSESSDSDISDEETGPDSESSSSGKEELKKPVQDIQFSDAKVQVSSRGRRIKANTKYTIDTEEYFANTSSKIKTSNNTLDKLETPRLAQYQLQKLLSDMKLSKEHTCCINKLSETNEMHFKKWLFVLNQNFNILLYGLGSKKNILTKFHTECLKDMPVIVVNGFFPTLSIKNILDSIIVDLLELSENPSNPNDACDLIVKEFKKIPQSHLYLLVHNIDGETLRSPKIQLILSQLAAVENIHLIATIDHINAPLIWDHSKLSKFNFIWWDVTSFLPYTEETSFERSMMVQQSGTLALSSLRNVFLSLTQNSKAIYLKIAKYQIENFGQYYQGMAFRDLYMACRESFIVSSDLALRAQLSEFLDHKMVKTKRSVEDGTEYLIIPLANSLLQKFMEENAQ
ncbi:origin recognition complex subunit 2 [Sitophilus oryzae]|uniref:Origin recognition complex subunit 2 n=1 Tax=Sitophilus oryzae TaxID=7048 RepID=A0A6J2YDF2_SITOR|nr:origin recognition complex subunit 2 [Sitophilus oryzae]